MWNESFTCILHAAIAPHGRNVDSAIEKVHVRSVEVSYLLPVVSKTKELKTWPMIKGIKTV